MNQTEFNHIVEQHSDALYRFSLKNIKVIEEAKEIVQNSFEKLWIHRNEVSIEKAKSYLFTCAYRNVIDIVRKQQKETEMSNIIHEPHSTMTPQKFELNRIIEKALQQLNELQRSAILLRDYEGYSYTEIGDILQISESQVKITLFRARKKLQEILGPLENIL